MSEQAKRVLGPRQQMLVDALRSKDYKQTVKTLRDNRGYCCLGVACEISKLGKWEEINYTLQTFAYVVTEDTKDIKLLPEPVMEFYGFKNIAGLFGNEAEKQLSVLNDKGRSFEQIAKIIEDNAEAIFKEAK